VTTFSTRAISCIELLIETAASARRIDASSLGVLTGGFFNIPPPLQAESNIVDIKSNFGQLFMDR
jgi:hypothetical protein